MFNKNGSQVLFSVGVLVVDIAINVQLAIFDHDCFVAKFHRHHLIKFGNAGFGLISEVCRNCLLRNIATVGLLQILGKVFYLSICQADAAMRCKRSNLRKRFATVNQ